MVLYIIVEAVKVLVLYRPCECLRIEAKKQIGRAKEYEKKLSDTKNEANSNLFIIKNSRTKRKETLYSLPCQL